MSSAEFGGLTIKERAAEAVYDIQNLALEKYETDATVELDPDVVAAVTAGHGLNEHWAMAARIVGVGMAKQCIPEYASTQEFGELYG